MNLIEMRIAVMDMAVRMHEGKGSTNKEVFDTYDALIQKLTSDLVPEGMEQAGDGLIKPIANA